MYVIDGNGTVPGEKVDVKIEESLLEDYRQDILLKNPQVLHNDELKNVESIDFVFKKC